MDELSRIHLAARYGHAAVDVMEVAAEDPALAERVSPGLPDLVAEAAFAARREQALTLADVMLRRTRLGLLDGARAQRPGSEGAARGGARAGRRSSAGTTRAYEDELERWREVAVAEGCWRRRHSWRRGARRGAEPIAQPGAAPEEAA